MPVETRAMRRAREAQGGSQTAAITATAATATTTTPRAPRKKRTGTKGDQGTKSKGELIGKKGVNKVQKSTKTKKGGMKVVSKAKYKAKGKKVANEDEVEDQEPAPAPAPEPEPDPASKEAERGRKGVDSVQNDTKTKKGGIKAVWKEKQKAKSEKAANEAELKNQDRISKVTGRGKEVAAAKVDKTEEKQVAAAEESKGNEKATAAREGKDKIMQRFTRADLQEAGALESDDVEMPTLTNDIHPIWAPEKFRFSSGTNETEHAEAYAAIAPALRLASLWIEQPQCEEFWRTMWHGEYIKPGRLMRIYRKKEDQAKSPEKNDSGERLTWKAFRDLASREEFKCEWRFGPQELGTWARTEEGIDGFSGCVTTLHDDFERLARSPRPNMTTSERLRFYFFLAINLGRELVQHVCRFKYREQHGDNAGPLNRFAVFYQTAEHAGFQLDEAWENFMFGSPIRQINSPMAPMAPDGLAFHHIRLEGGPRKVYMPVRVDWISERFSKSFWFADGFEENRTLQALPDRSNIYARELVID